ncbi:histidine triad nucleotide-binding protein [Thermoactinomyces mirandus]|uniref:Histidine triad nucleotide-binding protein n=1 Tax=Thermoactinomyces mirandus TaxID=2756294 RepID=A0A7W1XP90_9BACL|nr:histidine triad nucleotide-binding protein [Thermoactinomyces mirandus]MBA4600762.1 histidine triad nucleotide-binding protein [Thermoactinomyces mirandus]
MDDCIFCQIIEGKIPSKKVYEDEYVYAFHDISPAAPTHVLVIPKKHISSLMELKEEDHTVIGKIMMAIQNIAREFELDERGFRVVNNVGEEGGQTVFHLHFHLLGGRTMTWPPG